MNERESFVAGSFYPGSKERLEEELELFFKNEEKKPETAVIVSPHAGYEYSGRVAAKAFARLENQETTVILGPNHTGMGLPVSVSNADQWKTPLGILKVDSEKREKLLEALETEADDEAHFQEHSIEVQLPFLRFLFGDKKILPVCVMSHNLEGLVNLGNALALLENVSVVVSSDFSHFLPLENAREKDLEAIEFIKNLDIAGFYREVNEKQLSICGSGPIIAGMQFALKKGYKSAELLEYNTSASVTKDEMNVVGYAAIAFKK